MGAKRDKGGVVSAGTVVTARACYSLGSAASSDGGRGIGRQTGRQKMEQTDGHRRIAGTAVTASIFFLICSFVVYFSLPFVPPAVAVAMIRTAVETTLPRSRDERLFLPTSTA